MSFLDRAIRRGIGDAVSKAVSKAVEPSVTRVTDKAATAIEQAAQNTERQVQQASGLDSAVANLERSMQNYATQAAKSMKLCPNCQTPARAEQQFCPECGTRLPEQTVAQGAVCTSCGKQNAIGTKFCAGCGHKLPAAIAEEERRASKNAAVMEQWAQKLPQYPRWSCGGTDLYIEDYGSDGLLFGASFEGNAAAARRAVDEYRQILLQNGFRQAGQYPHIEQLYKRVDGVVYNVDTEHCFEGDHDCPVIGFRRAEPVGGFDYVKPAPKKKVGFRDLLGF